MITEVLKSRVARNGSKGGNFYPSGETFKSFQDSIKFYYPKLSLLVFNFHQLMDPSTSHSSIPGGADGTLKTQEGGLGFSTKRHIEFNPRVVEEGASTEEERRKQESKFAKKRFIRLAHSANT